MVAAGIYFTSAIFWSVLLVMRFLFHRMFSNELDSSHEAELA